MTVIGWVWNGLPWYVQWGAIAGACLMLVGLALNLGRIVKTVSGWWGVAGLGVFLAAIAAWVAGNVKPKPRNYRVDETRDSDSGTSLQKAQRTRPAKRPTIFDRLRGK